MQIPRPRPSTYFYAALAIVASAPAWIVKYPPLQDMPFHVAAMRVVHSFHDPAFGIDQYFELTFGRTQYFLYYVFGSLVAYFTGIRAANVLLLCVYLAGTPLAVRSLCRALGKDERLAIFVLPGLVNVMFMFGLLPFLFGIPLMFWSLAAAIRYFDELQGERREKELRKRGVILGALVLGLFFSHIFPFVLFVIGFVAIFPWSRPRDWFRAGLPTVPSIVAAAWWFFFTQSGKIARGAVKATDTLNASDLQLRPLDVAFNETWQWTAQVFRNQTDELWFIGFLFVVLLAIGLAQGDRSSARREARLLIVVPLACFILYFTTARGMGSVWLVCQRFPALFVLSIVPFLRFPRGERGWLVTAAALIVGVGTIVNACKHFIEFQLEEVGDIDDAIDHIPPGKKVAALIFDKTSSIVQTVPFLHFGSYYQADRGGMVEFTYAGYTHWPFDFKDGHYPPQPGMPPGHARLRWEWTPEQVSVGGELMPWYDYVLERGAGFHPPPGTFHEVWRGDRWSVWKKD